MPYADPQARREHHRRYYAERRRTDPAFREAERNWRREWRRKRPEWVRAANKRAAEKARASVLARAGYLIARAKQRCKEKGWTCDLRRDWVMARIAAGCELTGSPFDLSSKRGPLVPSIDRIDSSKGYTADNCRVIVLALNVAFSDWGEVAVSDIWKLFLNRRGAHVVP